MTLSKKELAKYIDHSLLKPQLTYEEIINGCQLAKELACATVCVNPASIALSKEILTGSSTKICSVVGFPSGAHTSYMKAKETEEAHKLGATEIDMVIHTGALKSKQYKLVEQDIAAVVQASPAIVKVILEMCYLTEEEKVTGCKLTEAAGAHYVKTSTGFAPGGATLADIQLMKKSVGSYIKIKAAGGIKTLAFALQLIEAGSDRIGVSGTKDMMAELDSVK